MGILGVSGGEETDDPLPVSDRITQNTCHTCNSSRQYGASGEPRSIYSMPAGPNSSLKDILHSG